MRRTQLTWLLLGGAAALCGVVACAESSSETPSPDPTPTPVDDDGAEPGPDASEPEPDADTDPDAEPVPTAGWTLRSHTCPGINRTDELFDEGDDGLWIGCGTGAAGTGLFHSIDEGASWSKIAATGANTLESFRVNSIERGPDGALYVAGTEVDEGNETVLRVDTSGTEPTTSVVLSSVNQVGYQFVVGNFRQLSTGAALAESLNGTDALFRADANVAATATSWTKADPVVTGNVSTQILDLVVHDDKFYGAGGTISQPPYVFLPNPAAASPYELLAIELPRAGGSWTGEMWGLAVSDAHVVVVGVNQDDDTGRVYVSGPSPSESADFVEHDLSVLFGNPEQKTWARGACTRGERIVVVGERQPLRNDTGLVFESTDGGQTFRNITPEGVSASVSKCTLREDGTLIVAGAAQIGLYR